MVAVDSSNAVATVPRRGLINRVFNVARRSLGGFGPTPASIEPSSTAEAPFQCVSGKATPAALAQVCQYSGLRSCCNWRAVGPNTVKCWCSSSTNSGQFSRTAAEQNWGCWAGHRLPLTVARRATPNPAAPPNGQVPSKSSPFSGSRDRRTDPPPKGGANRPNSRFCQCSGRESNHKQRWAGGPWRNFGHTQVFE